MKAITTQYFGPGNVRGSRIKAIAEGGSRGPLSVTVSYDHALNADENHAAAARALAVKYNWDGRWVGGGLPSGKGMAFVLSSPHSESFTVRDAGVSATVASARKAPARRRRV